MHYTTRRDSVNRAALALSNPLVANTKGRQDLPLRTLSNSGVCSDLGAAQHGAARGRLAMNLDEYLSHLGFRTDPFASTNADSEDLLQEYFVPPPYFVPVLGQPASPESHIVFAPRGGGKTAQRRMIEMASEESTFLCVLHDRFPVTSKQDVIEVSLDTHLREVSRKLLVAVLVHLDEHPKDNEKLSKESRNLIVKEAVFQLGPLSADEFHREVQSLKSLGKRTGEWIREHAGPIKPVISAIFKKAELEPPDFESAEADPASGPMEPWSLRLAYLTQAAQGLGYQSVYVLIDKVDELQETSSDPLMTFELVAPLITNLPSMEMKGICFKVFLWDRAQTHYIDGGGRPDRVRDYTLGWNSPDLADMMSRRLSAHSDGTIASLNDLMEAGSDLDLQNLAADLAHGSPRDMVRLASEIRATHLNRYSMTHRFNRQDVFDGIREFSLRISDERSRKFLPDLLKTGSYRFTQSRLANDLLKITKQSVQAKVAEWRKTGLIEKVAELQDSRNRPQHLYGVVDTRLAIAMREDLEAEMVLGQFVFFCPECAHLNISDETAIICAQCKSEFPISSATTLLDARTLS